MNRMQKLMLVGVMCAYSLFAGCSVQKPEDVVKAYYAHLQKHDANAEYIKGICTEKRYADLMKEAHFLAACDEISYEISEVVIRGRGAMIAMTVNFGGKQKNLFDGEPKEVEYGLVRESGGWKISTKEETNQAAAESNSSSESASDQVVLGRKLFVAMTQACIERECAGLPSVWPKKQTQLSGDKDDICGLEFRSSTEYFKVLLDMDNYGKPNWAPYVSDIKPTDIFDEKTGRAKWIVVKGITDETDDSVPVLLSSNVEVNSLLTKKGSYKSEQMTGELKFAGSYAVVIRKGGAGSVVKPRYSKHRAVYLSDCEIADDIEYLKP